MAAIINLSGFGNAVGLLPTEALKQAAKDALAQGTAAAEDTYRKASSTATTAALAQRDKILSAVQSHGNVASKLLRGSIGSKLTSSLKDQAHMLGQEAAMGAQEQTMDTLKKYAPWAIGGAAVLIGAVIFMRRK